MGQERGTYVGVDAVGSLLRTGIVYYRSNLGARICSTYKDSVVDSILTCIGSRTILLDNLMGSRIVEATRVVSVGYVMFIHSGGPATRVVSLTRRDNVILLTARGELCRTYNVLCDGNLVKGGIGGI